MMKTHTNSTASTNTFAVKVQVRRRTANVSIVSEDKPAHSGTRGTRGPSSNVDGGGFGIVKTGDRSWAKVKEAALSDTSLERAPPQVLRDPNVECQFSPRDIDADSSSRKHGAYNVSWSTPSTRASFQTSRILTDDTRTLSVAEKSCAVAVMYASLSR